MRAQLGTSRLGLGFLVALARTRSDDGDKKSGADDKSEQGQGRGQESKVWPTRILREGSNLLLTKTPAIVEKPRTGKEVTRNKRGKLNKCSCKLLWPGVLENTGEKPTHKSSEFRVNRKFDR